MAGFTAIFAACAPPRQPTAVLVANDAEVDAHRLSPIEPIRARRDGCFFDDLPSLHDALNLTIVVDRQGRTTLAAATPATTTTDLATPASGRTHAPSACMSIAAAEVQTWRYRPFEREGKRVVTRLNEIVPVYPPEIRLPKHVPFPEVRHQDAVRIVLERQQCYGSCPDYRVEIRGDGSVIYKGESFVLVAGEHRYNIDRGSISRLVGEFRASEFFSLLDHYRYPVTDLAGTVIAIEVDGRLKSVYDYVGLQAGMPTSVRRLEDLIDRVAGTETWVTGDFRTVRSLRAEGFEFRSKAGGELLRRATWVSSDEVVLGLIEAGAPVLPAHPAREDRWQAPAREPLHVAAANEGEAMHNAAARGRLAVVRALGAHGYFERTPPVQWSNLLSAAAQSARLDVVREILTAHARTGVRIARNVASDALLSTVSYQAKYPAEPRDYRADAAGIVRLLCQLGADPNIRGELGATPLHDAADVDTARNLIACGADVDARNDQGETPLLNTWDEEIALALIAAGADTRATAGNRSLQAIARERQWTRVAQRLGDAGR